MAITLPKLPAYGCRGHCQSPTSLPQAKEQPELHCGQWLLFAFSGWKPGRKQLFAASTQHECTASGMSPTITEMTPNLQAAFNTYCQVDLVKGRLTCPPQSLHSHPLQKGTRQRKRPVLLTAAGIVMSTCTVKYHSGCPNI